MNRPPTLLVVPDGMAGWPQDVLGGQTPLEAADTPNLRRLVERGRVYRLKNIPDACPADSGIANLALLGYDPREHHLGRGPLEALNLGLELEAGEVAFRCNLVTVDGEDVLEDYSSGNLPTDQSRELFEALDRRFADEGFRFVPGLRYRGVMVARGLPDVRCYLPHDEMGRPVEDVLPEGPESDRLRRMMAASRETLENHPVNRHRREAGEPPANMAWPWGGGTVESLPSVRERYGLAGGSVVAGVDLINGLGLAVGLRKIDVPGATGDFDTDMEGKARAAVDALKEDHLVFLHVEAIDEAGHEGDPSLKVDMIERFDREMLPPVLEAAEARPLRLLLAPDHYTPVQERTHVDDPVPLLVADEGGRTPGTYSEPGAEGAPLVEDGWEALARYYAGGDHPFV